MPSELRYIMFTEKEIAEAAIGYLASRSAVAPTMKSAKPKLENMSAKSVVIGFQKDEFGKRERCVLTTFEIIDALVSWCRARTVVLPMSARKDLVMIGRVICMRITLNIPEKNVPSVERLLVDATGATKPASAA